MFKLSQAVYDYEERAHRSRHMTYVGLIRSHYPPDTTPLPNTGLWSVADKAGAGVGRVKTQGTPPNDLGSLSFPFL